MTDPIQRIEELFQAAADLPATERASFLRRECGGESDLERRVLAMLSRLDAGDSLAPPPAEPGSSDAAGTVIGRYKLLEKIGEGGFGVVYMAEQREPVVRKVALKIIKLGMDTREVVARFEAERQALALMDHPSIARVLDGGATETGRPYFVMELVRGISITEYCDSNRLGTKERLDLFTSTCLAVQHAHQKGVIHRDIKPSNVLVTMHDGKPMPKVIDFGIAKAISSRLTEKTLFTAYHRFIGTPAYMSPEQAQMSALDVDTRTDIYSLGVLLYELLTGSTPFDAQALFEFGLSEVQRVLCEEPPQRPSLRIGTSNDTAAATSRQLDVAALARRVRGDLDWIVLKALEKERTRRYGTASELAADVERHLRDEPVVAGPPGAAYRTRKFLSRNRTTVGVALLFLIVLIGGVIGTGLSMLEASRQRDAAIAGLRRAEETTEFLIDTLALADPEVALEPSVRRLLAKTAERVESEFRGDPRQEARLIGTIGRAYESLGENELAGHHLRRAVRLYDEIEDPDLADLYDTLWNLTHVAFFLEFGDAFAIARRARGVAHDHIRATNPELAALLDDFDRAGFEVHSPNTSDARGIGESVRLFEECRRAAAAALAPDDPLWPMLADTYLAAGYNLWYTQHEPHAEAFLVEAIRIQRESLGKDHPSANESVTLLANQLNRQGRVQDAELWLRELLASQRQVYENGSFQVALAMSPLGENLVDQKRFAEAERLLLDSHEIITDTILDPTKFFASESYRRVAKLYDAWEREDLAAPFRDDIARNSARSMLMPLWDVARLGFLPAHAELVDALGLFCIQSVEAYYSVAEGDRESEDITALLDRIFSLRSILLEGDPDREMVYARLLLASCNSLRPTSEDKRRVLEEVLPILQGRGDERALDTAEALALLSGFAALAGDEGEAQALTDAALSSLERWTGDDSRWTAIPRVRIARALVPRRRFAAAELLLTSCHRLMRDQVGPTSTETRLIADLLVELFEMSGRPDRSDEYRRGDEDRPAEHRKEDL